MTAPRRPIWWRTMTQSAKAEALRTLMDRGFTKEQAEGIMAGQERATQERATQ